MTIRVVISWNRDDEIDEMIEVSNIIREALRTENLYNGTSTMNDPPGTYEIHLKNQRVPYNKSGAKEMTTYEVKQKEVEEN